MPLPGNSEHRSHVRKRLFHGLILSALLSSGYLWVTFDKTVQVEVDGQPRAVRTFAGDVGGVLSHAGIKTGEHDLVAPAKNVAVKQGSRIVVRRGRQLTLRLNGKTKTVWVTALSVDEALDQLAVRDAGRAFVSASRSRPIPLSGMAVEVRTPARVNILADGHVTSITTTVATLKEAFAQAHVKLSPTDKVSAPLTILPLDGLTVRVTRISAGRESEDIEVPFATIRKPDASMWLGETRVATRGVPGVRVREWVLTYTNYKLTGRHLSSDKLVRKPTTQVVYYGTRHRTVDDLNWYALARCESGNNPRAVSSGGTYRGLYQFRLSTWHSVGGVGDPIDASRDEQTYRAKKLYLRSGRGPWPYCGRFL
jgi:uncharacterized protein YabE (DUF348 family)